MWGLWLASGMADKIDIIVCRKHADAGAETLRVLRRWHIKASEPALAGAVGRVSAELDLAHSVARASERPAHSILVTVGFTPEQVDRSLGSASSVPFELIVCQPGRPSASVGRPTSSLLSTTRRVVVSEPLAALRKSVLRLLMQRGIEARRLKAEDEFRDYFALRYRVWSQMKYIPDGKKCTQSRWEVDCTDRTGVPVGFFGPRNKLVACARLVRGDQPEDARAVAFIHDVLRKKKDESLLRNFRRPRGMKHVFDVLESFPAFGDYYSRLVRRKVAKAEISRVIVAPRWRKKGLGEVLVDTLVSVAEQLKVQVLFLACLEKHGEFYTRSGFQAIEGMRCEEFANVGVPAIGMELRLS